MRDTIQWLVTPYSHAWRVSTVRDPLWPHLTHCSRAGSSMTACATKSWPQRSVNQAQIQAPKCGTPIFDTAKFLTSKFFFFFHLVCFFKSQNTLLSDSRSRVRTTLLWVFVQFCQFHMYKKQEQSRGKFFLERFLSNSQNQKKLGPFSMQILLGCVDSITDSLLLI